MQINVMKKLLLIFIGVLLLWGCTPLEFEPRLDSPDSREFTLAEAKEFFEENYVSLQTKSSGKDYRSRLSPGDFTPKWNTASYSESDSRSSYDVPILSGRKLTAVRATYRGGRAYASKVRVYQKLLVVKRKDNEKMGSYILTLIPEVGHDSGSSVLSDFRYCGAKGGFTGLAVYTRPVTHSLVRVEKYSGGQRKTSVFVPKGDGTARERAKAAVRLLSGVRLSASVRLSTKSGEDWWDYDDTDYDPWYDDGFEDLGGGIYEDSDGNLYWDSDGDGTPDSMLIEPSVCTPDDEDNEEEEDDDWPPKDDDDDEEEDYDYYYDDSDYYDDWPVQENPKPDDNKDKYDEKIKKVAGVVVDKFGERLSDIKDRMTIREGFVYPGNLAQSVYRIDQVFDKTATYVIVVSPFLDDLQMKLVVFHEMEHMMYFQLTQLLGRENFAVEYKDLMFILNTSNNDVNAAHHEFMGIQIDEIEKLMRETFPGESEEFYRYGKWGGGAYNSSAFDKLSDDEQQNIFNYLETIGLYKE